MLRYRALLIDPGDTHQERPVQIYGQDYAEVERWAVAVLLKAISPEASVKIYETSEQAIALIPKRKPQA